MDQTHSVVSFNFAFIQKSIQLTTKITFLFCCTQLPELYSISQVSSIAKFYLDYDKFGKQWQTATWNRLYEEKEKKENKCKLLVPLI